MFGALFVLSAIVPPHELRQYGAPGPTTPEVKPDWYLLWVYGFLKIVPAKATFTIFGGTFGPNFFGGLLFPALVFGVLTFAPWMDWSNRRAMRYEYLEPARQGAVRMAVGVGTLAFLGMMLFAAYYDQIGLTLGQMWLLAVIVPLLIAAATWAFASRTKGAHFDPTVPEAVPASAGGDGHGLRASGLSDRRVAMARESLSASLKELDDLEHDLLPLLNGDGVAVSNRIEHLRHGIAAASAIVQTTGSEPDPEGGPPDEVAVRDA
ncbi:MAG: hypothetical protein ACR2OO_12285 [Thermomicrobiales bacterium]